MRLTLRRSLPLLAAMVFSTCAFADSVAWVATGTDRFGTVDLNTGAYSDIANLGFIPAGLGEIGQSLYTGVEGSTTLEMINPTTGSVTAIGNGSTSLIALGSTTTGLYMIDTAGGLWNISATTGASSYIGATLLPLNTSIYTGMSTGSSTLYFALGTSVYTINTANAQASYVGSTAPNMFGALTDIQGSIYGASVGSTNQSYTFNPTSGTSTFLANTSIPGYAYGLAPQVPEPGSLALLGLAGALFSGFALKRKRS